MKDLKYLLAVIACLSLFTSSCSIKEDRRDCPVILALDMSSSGAENQNVVISTVNEEVMLKQYYYPGLSDSLVLFSIPKGTLMVSGITSLQVCHIDDLTVRCPEGMQYDKVYTYSKFVTAIEEFTFESVVLHKQYAALEFVLTRILSDDDSVCEATITGNYSGLNLIDGSPIESYYLTPCECVDSTFFKVRVPRQGDDKLELNLVLSSGKTFTFPIGTMLSESGYDWCAEDLDDARIEISTIEAGVSITILDWETGFEVNVRI